MRAGMSARITVFSTSSTLPLGPLLKVSLETQKKSKLVDDLQFGVRAPNPELQLLEVLVSDDPVLPLVIPSSANLHQQLVGTTRLKKDLSTSG